MRILFLSFMCEDIGVAVVTNMISQSKENFPLRHAPSSFEISLFYKIALKCKDSTVIGEFLNELPNFHIDTFSELE